MSAVTYYISLPLIYLISFLPFWWLYRLSDFLFIILYYVLGYRKSVVMLNLQNSFPEKSAHELKRIQYKFYQYFCDLILESLKTLTISASTAQKRVSFEGIEIFQEYFQQKQSTIIAMGHWGNWELAGARFAHEPIGQLFVIYHPLHNKHFNKLVYKMRTRLGNGLYPMNDVIRGMITNRAKVTHTAFIADQTPPRERAHWMTFLNQDTPFFTGTGKIATKMNYPVVYLGVRRVKRGYYEMKAEKLVPNPAEVTDIEILESFGKRLEMDIQEMPETWLWTHRRWKHKRKVTS